MIFASFGLAVAAAFAGAAFYINFAEQPARLNLDDDAMLTQWKPSYARGFQMQATLAIIGGALGAASYFAEHNPLAALGGLLMLANWPFTLLAIMPTNKRLMAMPRAAPETRPLIQRWARLHAVRTCLGLAATGAFLIALVS